MKILRLTRSQGITNAGKGKVRIRLLDFLGGTALLTNFYDCLYIFLKVATHWWQVRYVPCRSHSKETNYCTRISSTQVVIDLWIKTRKILISHIFTITSKPWSLPKQNSNFLSFFEHSYQIHLILCPKLLYFFRKYTNSSKIRSRGPVPP